MDKIPFDDSEGVDGPLYVDPKSGRKRGAGFKLLLSAIVLVALIALPPTLFALGRRAYRSSFPHVALYQNETLDMVQNRSLVVQPLIGYDQTFDIAVTIWQKRPSSNATIQKHPPSNATIQLPKKLKSLEGGRRIDEDWLYTYHRLDETEQVIYSDIVFRGLRLKDKGVQAKIQFQLSLDAFRGRYVRPTDVRASFVLIPSTPSLMDHFRNPSAPDASPFGLYDRIRFWSFPFPLGSTNTTNRTVTELGLETFAISVPLLKTKHILTQCPKGKEVHENKGWSDDGGVTIWLDDPRRVLENHPFIVTRAQLRVAEEGHIFNKEAFDKAKKALRGWKCLDHYTCQRRYRTHGHLDSLLELAVPSETSETGLQTEYAYPPYMSHFGDNLGPKDLLRLPIAPEKCLNESSPNSDPGPEFLNVTWHVSYAGRSPSKMLLGELYQTKVAPKPLEMLTNDSMSDYDKAVLQADIEALNGVLGHRHGEDVHPRRRFWIFWFLFPVLSFFIWMLEILYWHRCTSTVFISVPGIALLAIGRFVSMIGTILETTATDNVKIATSLLWELPLPFLMLISILRVEFIWHGRIPWLHRARPTHSERSSERLDSKTTPLLRMATFAAFSVIYFVSADWFIISPFPTPPDTSIWYSGNIKLFAAALQRTGQISQMVLNHRTRVFAGTYKTVIWMQAVRYLLTFLSFFPILFGALHLSEGLSVSYLVLGLTWVIPAIWQAVVLPRPVEVQEEDTKSS
ncbi:hypothetical protein C8J56DRAFT_419815 [Mycena floridula]|nr:hypothetical protein C8J56DRAFT_419815 [Mycena floridula]